MCLLISATDCTVGRKTWIDSRAVMIPGLESAPESHFGFFGPLIMMIPTLAHFQ